MNQPCTSTTRRVAAIGAAVAIVTASSAFGIGAATAVAAEPTTATSTATPGTPAEPAAPAVPAVPVTTVDTDEQPGGPSTDPTPAPVPETAAPEPTAPAAPATPAAPAAPAAEDGSDLAFTEPSTAEDPIELTATSGTPFTRTFETTGGDGTVGYAIQDAPSSDYWVNVDTGVLSGDPKEAGTFRFQVVALSGSTEITQYVELTVAPGDPVGVTFGVATPDYNGLWQVETDGTIWEQAAGQGRVRIVPSIPVAEDTPLTLAGLAVDAYGNRTTPGPDYPRSTVTSTDDSDSAVWNDGDSSNTVTFGGTGTRTVTVSEGGVSTSFEVVVGAEDTDEPAAPDTITFTEPSTPESPIRIETTAGEQMERTFTATGSSTELHYVLLTGPTAFPVPGNEHPIAPLGLAVGDTSGILSGAPTVAGEYDFQVMAMNGSRAATQYVHLSIRPAATEELSLLVGTIGSPKGWLRDAEGLREIFAESPKSIPVDAVPVAQGATMVVRVTALDAFGNSTKESDGAQPVVTSSVASDEVTLPYGEWEPRVGFPHASPHTITVALGDVSTTFDVDVRPSVATVGDTTPTAGGGGHLAYTGADASGPLAWALGLLAAGGGLLVHRLRRRRA
ncbi:hypothetical protein K0028_04185 [Curtobacterium flaccumfaciens pv. flaccumfaciens]|uniref:hypothetical protein n=1 Tax=Curtobacterium flaccumfaciens TaxID=2035 RepID=UPI00217DFA9B|nr:hypothetical protein [Curtobacterium flaccumfaciens]MCS6554167.1 hypothetical protein [Curtobacterium flaccumfaciens]QYI98140.1 hypothetical protein K0028_04185 [Curtobacterium flaccumfaciens pv. flaccumfaciens]